MFHVKQNPTDIPQKFRKMLYKGGKSCYNERVFVCVMHTFNQIRCAPGKTGRNPTSGTPQERRKQREYGVCSSEPERRRGKNDLHGVVVELSALPKRYTCTRRRLRCSAMKYRSATGPGNRTYFPVRGVENPARTTTQTDGP